MGYLFLGISLLAGVIKGYCGKRTSGYVESYSGSMFTNLIRMMFCVVIGAVMMITDGSFGSLVPDGRLVVISVISGISTSVFLVCWLVSIKKSAYMMLNVFLMLSVLVPICGGYILFDEKIRFVQWIGILILVVAAYILCSYNNSIKGKMSLSAFVVLLLCGIASGVTDFMQKMFVKQLPQTPISIFNFYTYLFSAIVLLVFLIFFRNEEKKRITAEFCNIRKMIGYIAVMAVCLFVNSFFKTKAAVYLDSVQLYPLSQGGGLILSALMAAMVFHEKLTWKCIGGLALAFSGLVVLNML